MMAGVEIQISDLFPKGQGAMQMRPDLIVAGPVTYAMMDALLKFQGRDRRRVKREMNKAARNARRKLR